MFVSSWGPKTRFVGAAWLFAAGAVWAQSSAGPLIYNCIDPTGKKITSDRPIPQCVAREQRVLNADGSLNRIQPPTLTAEEAAAADERNKATEIARIQQRDAQKRDQNLLARYPDEAAHAKARQAALEDVRGSLQTSQQRLAALAKERKPLNDEAEFYVGKPLPFKLKTLIDANDASVEAQQSLMQNQKVEMQRIDKLYDDELARLRLLWAGARPGTIGPLASASAPPAASRR